MKEQILIVKRKPFFNCQLEYLLYNSLKLQYCYVGVEKKILIYFYCKYNIKNKMTTRRKATAISTPQKTFIIKVL